MEPVRFADILFILLVCIVTFGILKLVNRKQKDGEQNVADTLDASGATHSKNMSSAADEDN